MRKDLMEEWVKLPPPWDDKYKEWLKGLSDEERALVKEWDEEVEDYVRSEM